MADADKTMPLDQVPPPSGPTTPGPPQPGPPPPTPPSGKGPSRAGWVVAGVLVFVVLLVVGGAVGVSLMQQRRIAKLVGETQEMQQKALDMAEELAREASEAAAAASAAATAADAGDDDAAGGGTESGSTSGGTSSGPAITRESGRHFGYIKRVYTSDRRDYIEVDFAQFLTGAAAAAAASAHGDESPPPNDYYIVNDNPRLRTFRVATGCRVHMKTWEMETLGVRNTVHSWFEYKGPVWDDGEARLKAAPYWFVLDRGVVLRIEEQYVP